MPARLLRQLFACCGDRTGQATDAVRRRRRRQVCRVTLTGLAVAVVVLVAVTVAPAGSPVQRHLAPSSGETRVSGHPAHIGWQWPVRDLPARPGPMAGLLSGWDGGPVWWVVRADGHRYRVHTGVFDDDRPALSADGRQLGYLAPDAGHYVIHDLVSGRRTVFDGVGDARSPAPEGRRFGLAGQYPEFWSPGGDLLAVLDVEGDRGRVVLLDARRGRARRLGASGQLAGWLPDGNTVVTVAVETKELPNEDPQIVTGTTVTSSVQVHLTAMSGDSTVVDLAPRGGWSADSQYDQWSWSVSPDGKSLLASMEDSALGNELTFRRFRLSDGREIGGARSVADFEGSCSVGWVDNGTVTVPTLDSHDQVGRVLVDVRTGQTRTATVVSRHVDKDGGCLEEARLALAGPAVAGGLLGQPLVTWALWLVALGLAVVAVLVVRRRSV